MRNPIIAALDVESAPKALELATQIGSRLRGVLYVLDEPSIGLHPRDNDRLLNSLSKLRDLEPSRVRRKF